MSNRVVAGRVVEIYYNFNWFGAAANKLLISMEEEDIMLMDSITKKMRLFNH